VYGTCEAVACVCLCVCVCVCVRAGTKLHVIVGLAVIMEDLKRGERRVVFQP